MTVRKGKKASSINFKEQELNNLEKELEILEKFHSLGVNTDSLRNAATDVAAHLNTYKSKVRKLFSKIWLTQTICQMS